MARALAIDPDDLGTQYNAAGVFAVLGEYDKAFDLLEPYLQHVGPEKKRWFMHDSDIDPLRSHPRYARLLELIG